MRSNILLTTMGMAVKEDIFIEEPAIIDDTDWLRYAEMIGRLAEVRTHGIRSQSSSTGENLGRDGRSLRNVGRKRCGALRDDGRAAVRPQRRRTY